MGSISMYAQSDGLGSIRLVTDGGGNATSSASYEPWGTPRSGSSGLGGFGYTGEQQDSETGLVYLRARSYDPSTGRFLQEDSYSGHLRAPDSQQRYAYVGNNPLVYTDPSGRCTDPGGPGLRYCIETFIPFSSIGGFTGDNRGPEANVGDKYRTHQQITNVNGQNVESNKAGVSEFMLPGGHSIPAQAITQDCGATITGTMGARTIHIQCASANGLLQGIAPYIEYKLTLTEHNGCVDVAGYLTRFPSLEIWQYSDDGPPKPILHHDGANDPLKLAPPIIFPIPVGPFVIPFTPLTRPYWPE